MHKDIVRRISDVQECLVSLLLLQHCVLLQRSWAEPILNDLAVFTELGSALEMNQDISPPHPIPHHEIKIVQASGDSHLTKHDQSRTTGINRTPLLQEIPGSRKRVEDQDRFVEDAEVVDVACGRDCTSVDGVA